jgi:endonuclease III
MDSIVDIDQIVAILSDYTSKIHTPILDLLAKKTADPFQILVGTLLSARTQDKTTAKVLDRLFSVVSAPADLEAMSVSQIAEIIYPVGFFQQKARYLKDLPVILHDKFDGAVPMTIDELIQLPGVGRKTANLVMILAFDQSAICVDTHVHRISNRIGYIDTDTPTKTEYALREKLPVKYWKVYNKILVAFGQHLCRPITPHCELCPIGDLCKKIGQ